MWMKLKVSILYTWAYYSYYFLLQAQVLDGAWRYLDNHHELNNSSRTSTLCQWSATYTCQDVFGITLDMALSNWNVSFGSLWVTSILISNHADGREAPEICWGCKSGSRQVELCYYQTVKYNICNSALTNRCMLRQWKVYTRKLQKGTTEYFLHGSNTAGDIYCPIQALGSRRWLYSQGEDSVGLRVILGHGWWQSKGEGRAKNWFEIHKLKNDYLEMNNVYYISKGEGEL